MSTLRDAVSAGESGPLIMLSGETDIATVAELSELLTAQLAGMAHLQRRAKADFRGGGTFAVTSGR